MVVTIVYREWGPVTCTLKKIAIFGLKRLTVVVPEINRLLIVIIILNPIKHVRLIRNNVSGIPNMLTYYAQPLPVRW